MKTKVMLAVCLSSLVAVSSVSFADHHEGGAKAAKTGKKIKCKDCEKKKKECNCDHGDKEEAKEEAKAE